MRTAGNSPAAIARYSVIWDMPSSCASSATLNQRRSPVRRSGCPKGLLEPVDSVGAMRNTEYWSRTAHHERAVHLQCTCPPNVRREDRRGSVVTVIEQWNGARATALRHAMRLSKEGFADKLGVSARAVAKWSTQPDLTPYPQFQQMLDTLLERLDDATRLRFSMLVGPPEPPELPRPSSVSEWILLAAAESSADAVLRSGHVSADALPELIQHVMLIARNYDNESRMSAFRHAVAMRDVAVKLADSTHRPGELNDIYVALGQLNALMASLAFDLGNWKATAPMARAATNYAEMAGHTSLQAWTAGLEATLAFWEGHGQLAVDRIDAGLMVAPSGAPRFRLLNIAARSHATLGNAAATRNALAAATAERDAMESARDDLHDVVGGEFAFDDARAAACAGAALLTIGDARNALWQTHQTFALHMSGTAPTSPAVLSGASVDGAAALALQGDLSGAETYLRPVLDLDPDPANASLGGRLRSVADLLSKAPSGADRAKELAAEVNAWLVGHASKSA